MPQPAAKPPVVAAIIPARYGSTRFPGKPLTKILGVPMIERVYQQARQAPSLTHILVATDDQRIADVVANFGGKAVMTRTDHASGTDRLAEVAQANPDFDIIVNVQGDEPIIEPASIEAAIGPLLADPRIEMSTLVRSLDNKDIQNPQVVKVVVDGRRFCPLFFALGYSLLPRSDR